MLSVQPHNALMQSGEKRLTAMRITHDSTAERTCAPAAVKWSCRNRSSHNLTVSPPCQTVQTFGEPSLTVQQTQYRQA